MSSHQSSIRWHRAQNPIDDRTYSRNHVAKLNGRQSVNLSASVDFKGDPACADPEQMLVTAVASCHMLTFLAIAEYQGYRVDRYEDDAVGYLEKIEGEGLSVTRIELSPKITFTGDKAPDSAALNRIHSNAHKNCFISKSIKAKVTVTSGGGTA